MIFFFRKTVPHFFSIEKVFFAVSDQLKSRMTVSRVFLPHYSSSIISVVKNLIFARKQKGELYHITGDVHYLVLVLPKNKTILTIHDCVFLHHYKGVKKWFLKKLFLTWPVKYSQVITTISEQSKREIINYTGCLPDKIKVINNPVAQHIYFKPREFNSSKPVLLFLGSTPNKNLARAIEAIKGIACRLHIVGIIPPEQAANIEKYQIEMVNSVNISETQLAEAFYEADLLYFPTLYEGFGLPIVEAQKAGRAVLTSNLSPMKEVAGGAACLVDPLDIDAIRNGLLKLIKETGYRQEQITKGFENVKRFEIETIADQYFGLYKSITTV